MKNLVVILGTNASGKSELGIRLAVKFDGEIVSADSRQVYRGLDIGTGKVTQEQIRMVPHHLIDIADVTERYSLAQYQACAYSAIDQIQSAGRLPFLVGGTGLYINAVVDGYVLANVPPKQELRAELERLSIAELAAKLKALDLDAFNRVDKNNPRRLVRAIEIASAGHPYSITREKRPRYHALQLGLTWDRATLEKRIEDRLHRRFADGMVEEVIALRSKGIPDTRLDELGLEYRFILHFLQGKIATKDELISQLKVAIRQFSHRQQTWFRQRKEIIWLDVTGDYFQQACKLIEKWLSNSSGCLMTAIQ